MNRRELLATSAAVNDAVEAVKDHLRNATADERLAIFIRIMDEWCPHCGGPKYPLGRGTRICQCWNDD